VRQWNKYIHIHIADIQLPLQVLGDDGVQEAEGLHNVHWGFTQGDEGRWGCTLSKIHNHLHCLDSVEQQVVLLAPGLVKRLKGSCFSPQSPHARSG